MKKPKRILLPLKEAEELVKKLVAMDYEERYSSACECHKGNEETCFCFYLHYPDPENNSKQSVMTLCFHCGVYKIVDI